MKWVKTVLISLIITVLGVSFSWADQKTPSIKSVQSIVRHQGDNGQPQIIPSPPKIDAHAYVLMDADSGMIIAQKNMHHKLPPASLTKLMTLYLTSRAIKEGSINLDDEVNISKKAWKTGGSRMFLRPNMKVSVRKLIKGVIVDSGNDATMALAQYVGGSEDSFVNMMNQQAQAIGMPNTHFVDPTGLPHDKHYSSAFDLAKLTRKIWLDFPKFHDWYDQKTFKFNGIKQNNRNRLLWHYPAALGMKTGHTQAAGYCLIGLAKKQNMTLIAVTMHAASDEARSNDTQKLLEYGYRFFRNVKLYPSQAVVAQPNVWYGESNQVKAGPSQAIDITIGKQQFKNVQVKINTKNNLEAPIHKGDQLGTLTVMLNNQKLSQYPIYALNDVKKAGFLWRIWDGLSYYVTSWFSTSQANQTKTINMGLDQTTLGS